MKGIHKVVVGTKYLKYEFELRRNLTIIRGDSATGKTTLVDMIRTHMNDGESGPVTLNCDKSCYVVEGNLWKGQRQYSRQHCFYRRRKRVCQDQRFCACDSADGQLLRHRDQRGFVCLAIQCGRSVWYPNLW